jgi:hypothetical protein
MWTLHDAFHRRFMENSKKPCTPTDWERFLSEENGYALAVVSRMSVM